MNTKKSIHELSLDFLICSYFGQSKDLVKAAIDRAYIDMASHTLILNVDYKVKWNYRYQASCIIANELERYPGENDDFDTWHKALLTEIKEVYKDTDFMDGQAHKWINMTIKYLFVFKQILPENDTRLSKVRFLLDNTNELMYHIPIDSYVLKGSGIKELKNKTWSTLDSNEYDEVMAFLGEERDFIWELEKWEDFSEKYSEKSKDSYAKYYDDKCKNLNKLTY